MYVLSCLTLTHSQKFEASYWQGRTTDLDHSKKDKKTVVHTYRVMRNESQLFDSRLNKNHRFRGHPVEQIQTCLDLPNAQHGATSNECLLYITIRIYRRNFHLFVVTGASFTGSDPTIAFSLLTLACGCNGFIYSGEQSAMLDIANNVSLLIVISRSHLISVFQFAGTLMGIINALGNY